MNELINNENYGINVDFEAEYFDLLFENALEKWAARVRNLSENPLEDYPFYQYLEYSVTWISAFLEVNGSGLSKEVLETYRDSLVLLKELLARC